jgi:hypothetical protein
VLTAAAIEQKLTTMSEAKKPGKSPKKHIADIEEPGTSAPSATSKPVIVTNRPILKDPMVVEKRDDADEKSKPDENQPATLTSASKPKLRPLNDSISPDAAEQADKITGGKSEAPDKEPTNGASQPATPKTEDDNSSEPESTKFDSDDAEQAPAESAPAEAEDKQKNPAIKQAEAEAAEQARHDEAIQKLVESKQYVLPINAIEQRKTKKFVILGVGLSILLVLIWFDIALDAGIMHIGGLHSATHFFSN